MDNILELEKYEYLMSLDKESYNNKIKLIDNLSKQPILTELIIHEEEIPKLTKINSLFQETRIDINYLTTNLIDMANRINAVMITTKDELDQINMDLNIQKEKLYLLNMLMMKQESIDSVIDIDKNLTGHNEYINAASEAKNIKFSVVRVDGNGYEGNSNVYDTSRFVNEYFNTDDKYYMHDNSLTSYYEYSKLIQTGSSLNNEIASKDSDCVQCSITINSEDFANGIEIVSDISQVVLLSIDTSTDGFTFTTADIPEVPFKYSEKYNLPTSGVLSFPDTKYIRLNFESKYITKEQIAFINNDKNNNKYVDIVDSIKRNIVRINNIYLYSNRYESQSIFSCYNLIDQEKNSVSLYADEIIPEGTEVEYKVIINNKEYNLIPINAERNGTKLIKYMTTDVLEDTVEEINERIKNLALSIKTSTKNNSITPKISNLKLIIGK